MNSNKKKLNKIKYTYYKDKYILYIFFFYSLYYSLKIAVENKIKKISIGISIL